VAKNATDRTTAWFDWLDGLEKALAESRISAGAFALAVIITRMINSKTGDSWPGAELLAKRLGGVSERTIRAYVQELEAPGLLIVERRGGKQTNRYRMALDRKHTSAPNAPRTGSRLPLQPDLDRQSGAAGPEAGRRLDRKQASAKPLEEPLNEPRETVVSLAGEVLTPFEILWEDYPKKRGKIAARQAFDRVLASGAATAAEVLVGVREYASWAAGKISADGSDRFIPNPAKWLADGGWNDRPLAGDRHGQGLTSFERAGEARRANLARAFGAHDISGRRTPIGNVLAGAMAARAARERQAEIVSSTIVPDPEPDDEPVVLEVDRDTA
jgi:hypothetical protein